MYKKKQLVYLVKSQIESSCIYKHARLSYFYIVTDMRRFCNVPCVCYVEDVQVDELEKILLCAFMIPET